MREIVPLATDMKEFTFERADRMPYAFRAGQHFLVWNGNKYSAFSLTSLPRETSRFNFAVKRHGELTSYLLDEVAIGDKVTITLPQGRGFDPEKLVGRELWFIAGGIGLMGLSAQILEIEAEPERFGQNHKLFYGLKDRSELLWPDRLESWRKFMTIDITGDGRHLLGDLLHEGIEGHAQVTALICGPAVFFQPIYRLLVKIGVLPDYILTNIWE